METSKYSLLTSVVLLWCCIYGELFAQGKIVGYVRDKKSGEPLVGVNVTIVNTSLGAATDLAGDFTILNVPVGTYTVQASAIGYSKVRKSNVVVSQGQTTRVDFELEETVLETEAVTVTATRDILHKEVSSSQTVVQVEQIHEAAGVTNLQEFIATQAGITNSTYLTIREGKPQETGTFINGITFVNTRVGKAESFIPTSAIEQVSIKTGGMTAEYGEFRSGVIDVTSKSGANDRYHGTVSVIWNQPQLKRFGRSLYDPMNNALRPHLDPDIAFIGVQNAVTQGVISAYEANQFVTNTTFRGFLSYTGNNLPADWKANLTRLGLPNSAISAVDLYLFNAWMHQVMPDFDKLNRVIDTLTAKGYNVGSKVTDPTIIEQFRRHANREGKYRDYTIDGGFGGPVPFIGSYLGNMTFYLSNITARNSYIQPLERDYDFNTTTMLVLRSELTQVTTLKLTGAYNYHYGMNPARGADSEVPNLAIALGVGGYYGLDRGAFMPEDNIPLFTGSGSNYGPGYWWYPTMLQPWKQYNYLLGANISHALSSRSYIDANISYQLTKDDINPAETRNKTILVRLGQNGCLPLNEMPYGRHILPMYASTDTVGDENGYWVYDQFYTVPGLSERFDSKGGVLYDNSRTEQYRVKLNYGNQLDKVNYVKAGVELFYMNLDNKRWSYWPTQGYLSAYEYNFKAEPYTVSAYLQDEITFEEMVLNIGLRMDYFSEASGLKWPTGRMFDNLAFGVPNAQTIPVPNDWYEILSSGRSLIWERWNAINQAYIDSGYAPLLVPVKSHLTFSPRIGIAFPITERAKFYFNYGHFRSLPPYSELYMYDFRYDNSKGGLYQLGNPNLEPSRTIQYELGVDYNLFDQYLIHIAGYYKDITGEVRSITFRPKTGTNFTFRTNDSYRDIEGVEIQITKPVGEFITGWAKLQYTYASSGNSGRSNVYEDSVSNSSSELVYYYGDPSRPDPVPQFAANVTFKTPLSWGNIFGGWNLSVMPKWEQGRIFRFNPRALDVNNEFRWPDLWLVNLKLSKAFDFKVVRATISIDVRNVLNSKVFMYNYAFSGGLGSSTNPSSDFRDYMASLHLKEYKDSYYNPIRKEKGVNGATADEYLYPGYVKADGTIVGEDHIGDMRSSSKPHINDPNIDIFTWGNPRSIWFGVKFDF
ncbi:MAG: TonB-dependent receptor [Bacteroidetes bacterium]|nr:TonB-dependent receptor [Bacteroidota bacterium]